MNYLRNLALVFFLFYSQVLPCVAQSSGTSASNLNLSFEYIGPEEGLDAGYNYWVKKDNAGLVWISSINGLFQFNGTEIKKYSAEPNKPNSMLGDNIQSNFFEDEKGDVWFATDEGINVFQRVTDDFRTIKVVDSNKDTIHQNYALFHIEKKGIWLKAEESIYYHNIVDQDFSFITSTKGVSFTPIIDSTGNVEHIISCPKIGASGFEWISRISDGRFVAEKYETQLEKGKADFYNNALVRGEYIWLIANKGIVRFNIKTREKKVVFRSTEKTGDLKCASFVKDHLLLVGSKTGLWQGDVKTGALVKVHPLSEEKEALGVSEIYIDPDNQIWLSYFKQGGVGVSWLYNLSFDKKLVGRDKNEIVSICKTSTDQIWALLNDDKIVAFDQVGNELGLDSTLCIIETSAIKRLVCDTEGGVYVNIDQAIYKYSFEKKAWENIFQFGSRIIYFDSFRKDELIVNTLKGFFKLSNLSSWQAQKIIDNPSVSNAFYFFVDSTFLFLPIKGKSMLIYNLSKHTPVLESQINIDFDIYDISRSRIENNYWLGTDKGLKLLEKGNTDFQINPVVHSNLNTGLVSNIIEDQFGDLWLTESRGLIRIKHQFEDDAVLFTPGNGLPSKNFSLFYSKYLDKTNKTIWLGTDNGILKFSPSKIDELATDHYPLINELKVNGVDFAFEGDNFELPYAENNLSFSLECVGTPLLAPYQMFCKLDNFDAEWQVYDPAQLVRYNKLAPGKYQLQFFAQNASLVNSKTHQVDFIIRPPFWQETWFLLLSGIGLVTLVFLSARLYFRQKIKAQQRIIEKQLMLQEERSRIAGELHDDLGSGLSTIKFLSEKVTLENHGKGDNTITKINNAAGELLEKMSTIIWAINSQNDSLESLVAYLYTFAYDYSEIHGIYLEANTLSEIPDVEISGEKRRHVYLIVQESFHNIVKHAKASKIKMHIKVDDEVLEITIKDNGQGILTKKKSNGYGLNNIKNRVQKLRGTISIQEDNGVEVCFSVPFAQQKL